MRPIIGITPDVGQTGARPGRPPMPRYELKIAYADAVLAVGGLPIMLPYSEDESAPAEVVALCKGIVITGGSFDIPPELYGARPGDRLGPMKRGRTAYEQRVLRAALAAAGTQLEAILGTSAIQVNSTHHQAVRDIGSTRVSAISPDNIIEAIELPDRFAIGVQWHPELLAAPQHLKLYKALVEKARK